MRGNFVAELFNQITVEQNRHIEVGSAQVYSEDTLNY